MNQIVSILDRAQRKLSGVPPAMGYSLCVVLEKGFSFVTVPLATMYLAPAEYGRLELATSIVEFVNIAFLLGLADTLVRFASTSPDERSKGRCVAELLGTGLVLAFIAGIAIQALVPQISSGLGISDLSTGLHLALAGASLAGALDLCLMWIRFEGKVASYVAFVAVRSTLQFALIVVMLRAGFGATGMLIANACVMLAVTSVLVVFTARQHGIRLSATGFRRVFGYGLPLVGGAFATFMLGTCSRWFLAGHVDTAEIAFLALAAKLAVATTLLIQPFMLWWKPRRLAMIGRTDASDTVMREWGFGFAILVVSALAVALAAPIFIALFLSASYAPATVYVPWMVLIVFINELNTLSSAGYYARSTGLGVMAVNTCGALVAVAGMLALIGKWGVAGAIAAMIAGQLTRLALFVGETLRSGTMRFPAMRMAIVLALASGAVAVSAASMPIAARVALCAAMLAGVATTLTILGFVQLPRPGQGRH